MKHLLSIDDLSVEEISAIFATATDMHDVQRREVKKLPALRGRTVVNLFFEDSTRTRSSFEIAGKWLSADVINISAKGSSTSKGESLRDTVLTVCAMGIRRRHSRAPDPGFVGCLHAGTAARLIGGTPRCDRGGPDPQPSLPQQHPVPDCAGC